MASTEPDLQISATSTREEVLSAVEVHEQRVAAAAREFDEAELPDVPDGFVGCVWSKDGNVRAYYGPLEEGYDDPADVAQVVAGEEDQTTAGWDGA